MQKVVLYIANVPIFIKKTLKTTVFKQLSWYTLAHIVVQTVAFLSAIIVSRYLGPINLGLFSFVQNYVGSFLTFVAGMDFYFVWKLAKSDDRYRDVHTFIGYKLNIYIAIVVVGIASAWFILPHDVATMVTIVLIPVFVQSFSVFSLYTTVTDNAKLVSFVLAFSSVSLFLVKVVLVYLAAPLKAFVVVAAVDLILNGIIFCMYYFRLAVWRKTFLSMKFPSFVESFKFLYSIRLSVIALACWQMLLRVDQLILATISNAYSLGIYSAAVKVAEIPNFFAGILSTVFISRIAYVSTNKDAMSKDMLRKMMLLFFGVGSAIAIGIILFAPLAVYILYGEKFLGSVSVLRIYALSIPGMFMNYFFLGMYGVRDKHHYQVAIFGASLAINIVLVYVLTPIFGLPGAALATVVAYSVAALSFYYMLDTNK